MDYSFSSSPNDTCFFVLNAINIYVVVLGGSGVRRISFHLWYTYAAILFFTILCLSETSGIYWKAAGEVKHAST